MKSLASAFVLMLASITSYTQEDSSFLDFSAFVHLDSIMITAKQEGFSVEEFIKVIQNDNSLEESFNNLRQLSYTYRNDIKFSDKKNRIKASYHSLNRQNYNGDCQWMDVLKEDVIGKYFKRSGKYKYYTSRLYDRVFYQASKPCEERMEANEPSRARRMMENRIDELKKLIYTPGKEVDIPLIGKKTAIFSEQMYPHYDFALKSRQNVNGDYIYVFTASIKPLFNFQDPDGSIVKFLEIKMMAGSFQVLSRKYKLQYNAGIYNFDILMLIELSRHQGEYIPTDIKYDGYWKVLGKKTENCKFNFKIIQFFQNGKNNIIN